MLLLLLLSILIFVQTLLVENNVVWSCHANIKIKNIKISLCICWIIATIINFIHKFFFWSIDLVLVDLFLFADIWPIDFADWFVTCWTYCFPIILTYHLVIHLTYWSFAVRSLAADLLTFCYLTYIKCSIK